MKAYAKVTNEQTKRCEVGDGTNVAFYKSIGMTLQEVEEGYDGSWYLKGYAPQMPQEVFEAQLQEQMTEAVQHALDGFAKTRGYDGIMSACSYSNSTDAQFKFEADYCIQLRDTTWRMGYAILAEVKAGNRPVPTVDELITELPVGSAKWPDEV